MVKIHIHGKSLLYSNLDCKSLKNNIKRYLDSSKCVVSYKLSKLYFT